jgi:uncharacterized protein YndB with AHSA1/START domain
MRRDDIAGAGRVVGPQAVRIERVLPGAPQRVWDHLTRSDLRRRWLAAGAMEPRAGGKVEHLFRHAELSHEPNPERYAGFAKSPPMAGEVTVWEPPHRLAYTWPGDGGASEVTFELEAEGDATRLVVTHVRLADRATMISVASGWGAHLGILEDVLSGRAPRGFWSEHARLEALHGQAFDQGPAPDHTVELELDLQVSPAEAYAAWTEPDLLRRWFGDNIEADIRVGGRYRAENRDGDTVYVHEGEYLALEPGRRVRMSFAVPNAPPNGYAFSDEFIEIRLAETPGGGTRLTFVNGWNGDAASAEDEAAVRAAWQDWLAMMKGALTGAA